MHLSHLTSNRFIKYISYGFFGLIIVSFVFFYGWQSGSGGQGQINEQLGRIRSDDALGFLPGRGWEPITRTEVRNARQRVVNRKIGMMDFGDRFALTRMSQQQGIRLDQVLVSNDEAIKEAIDRRILEREAPQLNVEITQEDVKALLQQQAGMNADTLRTYATSYGLSVGDYLERLRGQQAYARVERLVADDARVPLYDLWVEYQLANEKLKLEILPFNVVDFTAKAEVSEEEMAEYLVANHENFRVPAKRQYGYVKVDVNLLKVGIKPTDDELQAYLEENPEAYATGETLSIEDLYTHYPEDDEEGGGFALMEEALTAIETDPELPWTAIVDKIKADNPEASFYQRENSIEDTPALVDSFGKDFVDAAFALEQGGISHIVAGSTGFSIIRRVGTLPGELPALTEVVDEVRRNYIDEKAQELFAEERAIMRGEVETYATLSEFAEELGMKYETSALLDATATLIPGVGDLRQHAGYIRGLKPGQVSEMIPTNNMICALQILKEEESYLPELDEVRERIETVMRKFAARENAKLAAEETYAKLRGGAEFAILAEDNPTTPILTGTLTRGDLTNSRLGGVAELGGPLFEFERQSARLAIGTAGISSYGPSEGAPDGYALWQVVEIESPSAEDFRQNRRSFERERLSLRQLTVVQEWLADKRGEVGFELDGNDS